MQESGGDVNFGGCMVWWEIYGSWGSEDGRWSKGQTVVEEGSAGSRGS